MLRLPRAPVSDGAVNISTPSIIAAMLQAAPRTSDLIFSPGRAPQVETSGQLTQLKIKGVGILSSEDTARIAADLIGRNSHAVDKLKEEGSCDISYSLPKDFAISGEYFYAARQLRDRHARDSEQRAGFRDAASAAAAGGGSGGTSGDRAGDRADGQREILDAGGIRQQDQ